MMSQESYHITIRYNNPKDAAKAISALLKIGFSLGWVNNPESSEIELEIYSSDNVPAFFEPSPGDLISPF